MMIYKKNTVGIFNLFGLNSPLLATEFLILVSLCQSMGSMNAVAHDQAEEMIARRIANDPAFRISHMADCLRTGDVERVGMLLEFEPLLAKKRFDYSPPFDHCPPVILAIMDDHKHGRGLEMLAILNKYGADFNGIMKREEIICKGKSITFSMNPLGYAIYNVPYGEKFIDPLIHYGTNPIDPEVRSIFSYICQMNMGPPHNSRIKMSLKSIGQKLETARSSHSKL